MSFKVRQNYDTLNMSGKSLYSSDINIPPKNYDSFIPITHELSDSEQLSLDKLYVNLDNTEQQSQVTNEQLSLDKLYVNLDNTEQQSQVTNEKLEKQKGIVKKLESQLEKAKSQIKLTEININKFIELRKSVISMINIESEKIDIHHQETIKQLRESNQKLAQSLSQHKISVPILVSSLANPNPNPNVSVTDSQISEYTKRLNVHMHKYIKNPWHNLFLFIFSYYPTLDNTKAIDFINNIPNTIVAVNCRTQCAQWLQSKQVELRKSTEGNISFLDFAIILKNVIHELTQQPKNTKEDIYKMFNISI
jgi:hypothetical protein